MSETQHFKCTLKNTDQTLEEYFNNSGEELGCYLDVEEWFDEERHQKAVLFNERVYEIKFWEDFGESDVFRALGQFNGDIDLHLKYYDGGCSFDEAIAYALDNIEDDF